MKAANNIAAMRALEGKHDGETGLIVLGGQSGKGWRRPYIETESSVLIGANGVVTQIPQLHYWVFAENLPGDKPMPDYFTASSVISKTTTLINRGSCCRYDGPAIAFRRGGKGAYGLGFDVRRYGNALASGKRYRRYETLQTGADGKPIPHLIGTVALQCLHLAGILGLKEVHTVGLDLCWRGDHHWYNDPNYTRTNEFWNEKMFTTYEGLDTLWLFVDTAAWMPTIRDKLAASGLTWIDHSNGLLQKMGVFYE